MNKLFKSGLAIASIFMFFIVYSCTKENTQVEEAKIFDQQLEQRSSVHCEEAETGCVATYVTKYYDFPEGTSQYKDCEFWVEVLERTCGNQVDAIFIGLGFNGATDSDCAQALIDFGDPSIAPAIYNLIEQELLLKLVKQAALDLTSNNLPLCGTTPPPVVANMTRSACARTCYVPDPLGIRGYRAVQVPCGNNCCRKTYTACRDWLTGEIVITQISLVTPVTPCEPGAPELPCPMNTVWNTFCNPKCTSTSQGG